MVGSDLESGSNAGTTDIAEMVAGATNTDKVNLVVLTGGANKLGWQTPRSYIIENGAQVPLSFVPSSTDMSNPNNVKEFIDWGTINYPAGSYMITFWNHGGEIRGFGWVDGTQDHLRINQLQTAFSQSAFITNGTKFDVIGFDACLMANLEVQTMLKDFGEYFVGSEETEPGHGWDWKPIVEAMQGGDALFGDEIGTIIVDAYKQHATNEETFNSGVTLSVTDLTRIGGLSDTLQVLLNKVKADGKEKSLQKAISASEEYGKSAKDPSTSSDVVDLGDMLAQLKKVEPSLSVEVDNVMAALNGTVIHRINDSARPKANGMTIYLPHNVFSAQGELEFVIDSVYTPLNIASPLKNFILNDYIPFVSADNSAGSGFRTHSKSSSSFSGSSSRTTSILELSHDDDIEHVQIVLDEESATTPNEYILLGSTFPDSIARIDANTDEYYYFWDDMWLGLNGNPAYISDIHDYEIEDENGVVTKYHRVHIPAVLNIGTADEKDIIMSFRFGEDFDFTLESIMREHEGAGADRLVQKERILLQPGDEIQLIYEVFNEDTDEEYFYEKPGANFTIVSGNEDLVLAYSRLEAGTYNIGFAILDHSHNDTIIFDQTPYLVLTNGTAETFAQHQIEMFPNPADVGFNVEFPTAAARSEFSVSLTDVSGRVVFSGQMNQAIFIETGNIPTGVYQISLTSDEKVITGQVIVQH